MTLSQVERQTVLDIIHSSLCNPNASGNPFLSQLMINAKDGYFSLNLLKGLVTELKDYPLAYLQHCINFEQKYHPDQQRLELDCEQRKVRITRQTGHEAQTNETDAFGFLLTPMEKDTGHKRQRSPSSAEYQPSLQKQQKRSTSTYFEPYQPSFNYKALAGDMEPVDVLPVFYDDGKFYQDASFFNASTAEATTTPSYDKLDILPIGATQTTGASPRSTGKEKACWNCGSTAHEKPNCPEPVNPVRVEINRALYLSRNDLGGGGRYYEWKPNVDISGLEPGKLSDNLRAALGMYYYEDEPPYYRNMKKHGYPPGYIGSYADQERVMKLVGGTQLEEEIPDLKVFGHEDEEETDSDEMKPLEQDTTIHQETIRMVTYPGLYHPQEISRPDLRQHQYQSYYQQHYYDQYGNQQQITPQYQHQQQITPQYQHHQQHYSSYYYHQSYFPAYDPSGQQSTYYQYDSKYLHENHNQHSTLHDHIIPTQSGRHNDQPTPSHSLTDVIPPPPPDSLDDDIPPPPPPPDSLDDDIPPPPLPSDH